MNAKLRIVNCGNGYWYWAITLGRSPSLKCLDEGHVYRSAGAAKRAALRMALKLGLTITKETTE